MRSLLLLLAGVLSFSALPARAAERLEIPAFTFADSAAAAAAWKPAEGSDPAALAPERTPGRQAAVSFRCDMAKLQTRAYWDLPVKCDLARFGRIVFWVKAEGDLAAITNCSLYFNAGAGWYGTTFGLPSEGWQRVVIDRAAFNVEDTPEGWQAIQGIRVAFWKGQPRQATVTLGAMEAQGSDIVVVRDTRAGKEAMTYAEQMAKALARAGIDAGTVDDVGVEGGVLAGKRVAIYPNNPQPSDKEFDALEAFVRAGGRVLACYGISPRMAALLGIESVGYQGSQYPGQFSSMRFLPGGPAGLPREAKQASWNIQRVRPAVGARVLAEWVDGAGKDTGFPALVLGPNGAYLSHVLLDDDPDNKDRLLRGILGHFSPPLWEEMARGALAQAGQFSRWQSFEQACAGVEALAAGSPRAGAARQAVARARRLYAEAEAEVKAGHHPEALEPAAGARRALLDAFAESQPARADEFRAVWCHSAYGVAGLSWDEAIRRLKENGFNAVVPNMLWGGVADYPSDVLPRRERVAREGDQIALCLAACRKYGVALHVWKVDWNLSGAPEEFVARMRAAGRLQRTSDGKEAAWLCPSHPDNFALERDSLLEVVRKYGVDGIHFDYIRYPGGENCYCDGCRQRFEEGAGVKIANWPRDVLRGGPQYAAYQEFRRANITRLVKTVSEEARRLRPGIKISAAVFNNWPECRESVGQDWGAWVRQGYLDFVCPMDYTDSNASFRTMVQVQRDEVGGRVPLVAGVGASAPGLPLDQVLDQVQIARAEGADGFILFQYAGNVASEYVPALGLGATAGPAQLPYDLPSVAWRVTQEGQPLAGPARAEAPLRIEAVLSTRPGSLLPARRGEGIVQVTEPSGTLVKEIGRAQAGGSAAHGEIRLGAGLYRLVLRGTLALADGTRRPFVVRGPFVRVQ